MNSIESTTVLIADSIRDVISLIENVLDLSPFWLAQYESSELAKLFGYVDFMLASILLISAVKTLTESEKRSYLDLSEALVQFSAGLILGATKIFGMSLAPEISLAVLSAKIIKESVAIFVINQQAVFFKKIQTHGLKKKAVKSFVEFVRKERKLAKADIDLSALISKNRERLLAQFKEEELAHLKPISEEYLKKCRRKKNRIKGAAELFDLTLADSLVGSRQEVIKKGAIIASTAVAMSLCAFMISPVQIITFLSFTMLAIFATASELSWNWLSKSSRWQTKSFFGLGKHAYQKTPATDPTGELHSNFSSLSSFGSFYS